jgi:hypothetical protein
LEFTSNFIVKESGNYKNLRKWLIEHAPRWKWSLTDELVDLVNTLYSLAELGALTPIELDYLEGLVYHRDETLIAAFHALKNRVI